MISTETPPVTKSGTPEIKNISHNPELIRAWNDYAVPMGVMTPDVAMPLWDAFKAGWEERFKSDLTYERPQGY